MGTVSAIQRLNDFGIFRSYSNSATRDFARLNLIYGWNGSGKSTLSHLFYALERRECPSKRFHQAKYQIRRASGDVITEANIDSNSLNIRTFNQDFVRENISWDGAVKGLLIFDKQKIQDRAELDKLKAGLLVQRAAQEESHADCQDLEKATSKFLTESARRVRDSLQIIDTQDRRFLNYDKTKFGSFIEAHKDRLVEPGAILSDEARQRASLAARPEQLPPVQPIVIHGRWATLGESYEMIQGILAEAVVNRAVQRLTTHPDIGAWVEHGVRLHQRHDSASCEFCGAAITQERTEALAGHFNEVFVAFQRELIEHIGRMATLFPQISNAPELSHLYPELKADYQAAFSEVVQMVEAIREQLPAWRDVLELKRANPLDVSLTIAPVAEDYIARLSASLKVAQKCIETHNQKTQNFQASVLESKTMLELHFAARETKDFDYFAKVEKLAALREEQASLLKKVAETSERIGALESSLLNAQIGADEFNSALKKFIGRDELTLVHNTGLQGYEIHRGGRRVVDGNLSEGEKTAIAFVYFITKLVERDNTIQETVVVVDDPISSFDSNHLFCAYSFLRRHCEQAKQLFVLTHNFNFFRLVNDWFAATNSNRRKKQKPDAAHVYVIEASLTRPRASSLKNADKTITEYQSEYHYIFSRLTGFVAQPFLAVSEAYLVANLCRKLLETFFAFKYPKERGDFASLMNLGLTGCVTTTEIEKERIYRFINRFSHGDSIRVGDDTAENLQGEAQNVLESVFVWMKEVDPVHVEQMQALVSP